MSEKSFGVKQLNILGSSGNPPQIESAENLRIRVGIGSTVIIGDSDGSFNSPAPSFVDPNNTAVLNVGIVTANEYYGTFKGDIDPGTSTLSINSNLGDVLGVTDNDIFAQTATEDSILFWDSTATKTTYLKIGNGLTIDDDELKGDYSLPVTGDTDKATWTLTPGSGTGDPVTLKAGTNISIDADNVGSGEFTLNVASGAGITFSDIDVKQYSDLASPRTERSCIDPIVVHIADNVATIGIGNTSNAYGEKYVQATEPATSCDGDIWYDTTPPAGGANSGITVANQNVNLATLATKLDFVGNGVVASGTGATKTITIDGGISGKTKVATVYDQKTSSASGGTPDTFDAWRTRTLNTKEDPSSFVTIESGIDGGDKVFSLPSGSYRINWRAPGNDADHIRTRLRYSVNTDFSSSTDVLGESGLTNTTAEEANYYSCGSKIITITQRTYFAIQQYQNAGTWGDPSQIGDHEIYTQVFIEDLATAVKEFEGTSRIASVKDVKGNTDPGGQITANTWTTRDLNTIADPSSIGISVSSDSSGTGNYMTVPAGTYKITWKAPGWRLYTFQTKLEYSIDSTFATGVTKVIGSSEFSSSLDSNNVSATSSEGLLASVTFTQETHVRIRQWAAVTGPTGVFNGLGVASYNDVASTYSGESSIYTTVQIEDLAAAVKQKIVQGTPASASASGEAGDIKYDTNYIYVATGTNTWKRAALSTW